MALLVFQLRLQGLSLFFRRALMRVIHRHSYQVPTGGIWFGQFHHEEQASNGDYHVLPLLHAAESIA